MVAVITIIPTTLAAYWARGARNDSREAKVNANEAKENAAGALHEVKENGGMSDPDPTLKDYIRWLGEMMAADGRRIDKIDETLKQHIKHSKIMDAALAEVFFVVKPDIRRDDLDEILKN